MFCFMNAPAVTGPGSYQYDLLTAEQAAAWAKAHPEAVSFVGYAETADLMTAALGVPVALNRALAPMAPGDTALVCRPRQMGARIDPARKGDLKYAAEFFEFGLWTRLANQD